MHRMYEMIVDAGDHVFKACRVAKNEKSLKDQYGGNGEFIRIRDVTEEFPISVYKVINALKAANFGEPEYQAIATLLHDQYKNSID